MGSSISVIEGAVWGRATELITPFTEEKDPAVRRRYFEAGVAACLANGLTALQSNDGGGVERGNRGGAWEHYVAMEAAGTLPLRVYHLRNRIIMIRTSGSSEIYLRFREPARLILFIPKASQICKQCPTYRANRAPGGSRCCRC
eukprot:COSAG01_NODE_48_length_31904_cov_21.696997_33_plen_144_part_00